VNCHPEQVEGCIVAKVIFLKPFLKKESILEKEKVVKEKDYEPNPIAAIWLYLRRTLVRSIILFATLQVSLLNAKISSFKNQIVKTILQFSILTEIISNPLFKFVPCEFHQQIL
jgi:hypothetical protein